MGNVTAQYLYARLCFDGVGFEKDLIDAVKYFKLAADKGNSEASFLYCMMVSKGNWVPKNEEKGKKIFFNQSFLQWRSIL